MISLSWSLNQKFLIGRSISTSEKMVSGAVTIKRVTHNVIESEKLCKKSTTHFYVKCSLIDSNRKVRVQRTTVINVSLYAEINMTHHNNYFDHLHIYYFYC